LTEITGLPTRAQLGAASAGPYYPMKQGKIAMSRGGWKAAAQDSILNGSISPVNIGMKTKWSNSSRELEITVELYFTDDVTDNPKLNVAFLESHVWGPQTGGTPDRANNEHNHILRDLVTGQWGEEIASKTKGSVVTKTYKYTVDEKFVNENCDVAVYVTHNNNFNTYTGIEGPAITPNAKLTTSGATLAAKGKDEAFEKAMTLKNLSDKELTFVCSVTKSERTPSDWKAELSSVNGEVTLASGASSDITIKLIPGEIIGIGDAELVVSEKDKPENLSYKSSITAVSKEIKYLEINAGGSMETTLKSARNSALTLNQADAFAVADELTKLKAIVWNSGAKGGIDASQANFISQKISAGTGLLISGSVPLPMLSFDNPNHTLFSQLGISWQQGDDIQLNSFKIEGVAGDPVADGFSVNGTNAVNGYYLQPMTIKNSEKAVAMTMCTNVDKVVSVRVTNDNQKSIYLSFNLDIISSQSVKDNLIKKSLDWIEGLTSAEELDYGYASAFNEIALTVAPNPATANSIIKYNLNGSAQREINIVLMNEKGQVVDQIWSGTAAPGEGTVRFDCSKYAQGAYFLMLSSGTKSVTFPVTISR
jgi:hypothetical protein